MDELKALVEEARYRANMQEAPMSATRIMDGAFPIGDRELFARLADALSASRDEAVAPGRVAGKWDRASAEVAAWNLSPKTMEQLDAILTLLGLMPQDFEVDQSAGDLTIRWRDERLGREGDTVSLAFILDGDFVRAVSILKGPRSASDAEKRDAISDEGLEALNDKLSLVVEAGERATPGDWFADFDGDYSLVYANIAGNEHRVAECSGDWHASDARYIAVMRNVFPSIWNGIPFLLARLRTAEDALSASRDANERMRAALEPFAQARLESYGQRTEGVGPYLTRVWIETDPNKAFQRARAAVGPRHEG